MSDRTRARAHLRRLRAPQDLVAVQDAALFVFGVLREMAAPLPPALEARLAPWLALDARRRREIRRELRKARRGRRGA